MVFRSRKEKFPVKILPVKLLVKSAKGIRRQRWMRLRILYQINGLNSQKTQRLVNFRKRSPRQKQPMRKEITVRSKPRTANKEALPSRIINQLFQALQSLRSNLQPKVKISQSYYLKQKSVNLRILPKTVSASKHHITHFYHLMRLQQKVRLLIESSHTESSLLLGINSLPM